MFSPDPLQPLVGSIIELLGENPQTSVKDLRERLVRERGQEVSLQHVYRITDKLAEAQVLVKAKGTVSLNLLWLSYLEIFAQRARKMSFQRDQFAAVLPLKEGKRASFKVDSLHELQNLWNHLLVQLYRQSPQKFLFKYYSHAWWYFGPSALDASFYRRIKEKGVQCLWLYGNSTPLDRRAVKEGGELYYAKITADSPFPREGYNLNVLGDYVLECLLPQTASDQMSLIFQNIDDPLKATEALGMLFSARGTYTVRLWRSAKQSATLRRKIERCFLSRGR